MSDVVDNAGVTSRFLSIDTTWAGRGGGRIVISAGVTVCGRSSAGVELTASFKLSGSEASSIGESNIADVTYFGVSGGAEVDPYWSRSGNVWLRGLCELFDGVAGRIGRAVKGGTHGFGATPESGVKKGEVIGLNGPGENDEGAVSVNAECKELVLSEWNGTCP